MQYSYSLHSMHTLSRICKYTVQYSHKQTTIFWPPTLLKRSSPPLRPQWTLLGAAATTEANHQLSVSNANPIAAAQIRSFGPNLSWSIMDQRNDLIFESKTDSLVFKVFCYVAPTAKFGKLPDPLHASTFLSKIAMIHYACMYVYIYIYISVCVCVAHWSVGSVEAIWNPWSNHSLDPRMGCRWVWPIWPTQPSGRSPT